MKRAAVIGLAGLVLCALLLWRPQSPETPESAGPSRRVLRFAPSTVGPEPVAPVEMPSETDFERGFAARAGALEDACDLDVHVACGGDLCVALTESPDLDGPLGWAELALSRPRFVASTALRDLGLPAGRIPCGDAIGAVTRDLGAIQRERPDGTEVWCAIDSGSRAGDWESGARALCDAAARSLDLGVEGFADPRARVLRFE
ncbi:MAG: hypothetical protein R3F61_27735 [Myxococcota bacterium]